MLPTANSVGKMLLLDVWINATANSVGKMLLLDVWINATANSVGKMLKVGVEARWEPDSRTCTCTSIYTHLFS